MPGAKNILLISYYFPPLGMGGVRRALGLFKYLPRFQYDVIALTVKDIVYPEHDYSLLSGFDKSKIVRTGSLDPSRIASLLGMRKAGGLEANAGQFRHYLYFPDAKRGWNIFAQRKARRIIEGKKIVAIITTSPPPSTHLIGLKMKKELNIPWIADFRDAWLARPVEDIYPRKFQRNYALKIKADILSIADEIVSVNESIKAYLGRGEVIMNGGDIELAGHWENRCNVENDRFTIGILGTLYNLNLLEPLFRAVVKLIETKPELKYKLTIVHVGHCDEGFLNSLLNKYMLRENILFKGYLRGEEAFSALSNSDLLYLGIFSGRVFDCLMSGKPILGIIGKQSQNTPWNSPDIIDLVRKYSFGKVIEEENDEGISGFLYDIYKRKSGGDKLMLFNRSDAEQYSTLHMARQYAALLDKIIK